MEIKKEIPVDQKLSSDDLLVVFCDIFGQDEDLIRQWFPIFNLEQKLTYTFKVDKHKMIKAPEGGLISESYNIDVKNEAGETVMVVYMMPTASPIKVVFAWDIFNDEELRKQLAGTLPGEFSL